MKYIKNKFTIEKINIEILQKNLVHLFYCYSYHQLKKISSTLKKNLNLFHL